MSAPRLSSRLAVALMLMAAVAFAQSKGKPGRTARPKTPRPAAAAPAAAPASSAAAARSEPDTASTAANVAPMSGRGEAKTSSAPPAKESSDAGVTVVDKDGGTKQFKFGETDIEGRLKAPQLVYFLRRVRAEFAAGDLGHRSFMRELSETKRDPNF